MKEKAKEQKTELELFKRGIVDVVNARIDSLVGHGKLLLPANYSPENALMSAWLTLQSTKDKSGKLALTVCTHDSVANALLDMIVQGLTPQKDQCYFVVYGTSLAMLRSYFGDEALLRRAYPKARVYVEPIYKGDVLEYEIVGGKKMITKHVQKFENVGGLDSIIGGYAVVEQEVFEPGVPLMTPHCEIMNIEQIEKAWARGENWPPRQGKMSAHTDHPEEFVKKTVLARACKRLINASDDSYLIKAVERQAYLVEETKKLEGAKDEANKEVIDIETEKPKEPEPDPKKDKEPSPKEKPSSPAARFDDLLEEHNLDPTKARRLAAEIRKLNDVRNLGNKDFEVILNESKQFLAYYRQKYSGSQPKLDDVDPKAGF